MLWVQGGPDCHALWVWLFVKRALSYARKLGVVDVNSDNETYNSRELANSVLPEQGI
jgi:hypothetical protein